MQNKLLLSLWLVGAVLYAGGTIFFANAILGAGSRSAEIAADKVTTTPAPMQVAQCEPGSAAAAEAAKPAENEATAAVPPAPAHGTQPEQPVKTAALPAPAGDATEEAADGDSAPQPPTTDAGPQPAEDGQAPDQQPWEARTPGPNADQGQAEWAQIVASAADVHAQPSADAPSIYALPAGRQVRVLTRANGWAQVQDVASGGTGWVDARALAPIGAPGSQGRGGYGTSDEDAYADDGNGQDDWRWRRRHRGGNFADFVRRALGGDW